MKWSIRSPAKVAAFVLLWNPYFRTSVSYAARGIEDTWLDLSGDFARNEGGRGRQNPRAVTTTEAYVAATHHIT
jgi:hypothetical protein